MPWRPTSALAAGLAALALSAATPAIAQPPAARALLIGVGDYPALPERLHLKASAGDVARLRQALVTSGLDASAVTVMTEREGVRPTRAAMLRALGRLAAEARPGQQVLVYFSGHGAQQPARHLAAEPDGLEELYLAADASGWDGAARSVRGAVADFEMEAALRAIEAKGAQVWFVADACHAAGLTRGALPAGARVKAVSAADLHIPATAGRRGMSQEPAPMAEADFAGFYAAPPGGLALERPLPAGTQGAQPASVFTFALARALSQGRVRTLRDLALAAAAADLDSGAGAPTPVFEGALEAPVLGLQPHQRLFRVRRLQGRLVVQAGAVEGMDAGAGVVLSDAAGHDLGPARVARAGLESAELEGFGPLADGPLTARLAAAAPAEGDRGRRLLAALSLVAGSTAGLQVEARLLRAGCAPNPPARLGFPADAGRIDLLAPPPLHHCDVVYVRVANRGGEGIDLTPLYVDAGGAVVGLSLAPDDDVRLQPGQARFLALRIVTHDSAGRPLAQGVERLALVSTPAGERRLDLRALAGPAPSRGAAPALDRPGLQAQVFALRVSD